VVDDQSIWTLEAYREHISRVLADLRAIIDERDRKYNVYFRAAEVAILAVLSTQKEFRWQLDDQAKMLMPRAESAALIRSVEDKLYATAQGNDRERTQLIDRLALERTQLMDSIGNLESGAANLRGRLWAITAIAWLVALAVSIALRFIH
jgi:hypothetical protein